MVKKFLEKRTRRWCITDLVTDHVTGKLRESACWSNIGKAAVVWAYIKFINVLNFELMTLTIATVVIGHDVANRMLNQKQQRDDKTTSSSVVEQTVLTKEEVKP